MDHSRVRLVEQLAPPTRRGGERLIRFESGLDEGFHLPCQVVRPRGSSAEVGSGGDPNASRVRDPNALGRGLSGLLEPSPTLCPYEAALHELAAIDARG